jgi:hypothetical protein
LLDPPYKSAKNTGLAQSLPGVDRPKTAEKWGKTPSAAVFSRDFRYFPRLKGCFF